MTDHVAVRHRELLAHAGTVRASGDHIDAAADAGRAVRLGPEAYGKLCVMVPAMLGALQDVMVDGMASAAGSLRDTAGRLITTVRHYEATDGRRAQVFDEIRARR